MSAARLGKGDHVKVISGECEGAQGTIFWWGKSRYGDGMRAGVEPDGGGEKMWIDAEHLVASGEEGSAPTPSSSPKRSSAPSYSNHSGPSIDDEDIPF